MKDFRFALRLLAKRPAFTIIALSSLVIGIGLNAAVFAWFKAAYLDPFPAVPAARELVTVNAAFRDGAGYSNSYEEFVYLQDQSTSFKGLLAHETLTASLGDGKSAQMTTGGIVSGNYFDVLGVSIAFGRGFRPEEDEVLDRNPVLILGHALWQRRFAGAPDMLGRKLRVNGIDFDVVGVAPEEFVGVYGGVRQEFWIPLHMARVLQDDPSRLLEDSSWFQIMGRPRPGVTFEQIQAEFQLLSKGVQGLFHKSQPDYRLDVFPLHKAQRGYHAGLFQMVQIVGSGVILVFILACLNVANLLIGSAAQRVDEIKVRLCLGASRWRLLRQLLTESVLLAGLAGIGGIQIAYAAQSLPAFFAAENDVPYFNAGVDWSVVSFLIVASLMAAAACGFLPAILATRTRLADAVTSNRTTGRNLWRRVLVVFQVALSLTVLTGTALLARHHWNLVRTDFGFAPRNILAAETDFRTARINEERGRLIYRNSIEQLLALSEVESAAWATYLPMSGSGGGNRRRLEVSGFTPPKESVLTVIADLATPGFLKTLGVPLVKGRDFEWSDDQQSRRVVTVNQEFAYTYLQNRDPIGVSVRIGREWHEIVGVYANYVYRHPTNPVRPSVFLPLLQEYDGHALLVLRSKGDPLLLAATVRKLIEDNSPNLAVANMKTMEDNIAGQLEDVRVITIAFAAFALISCTLAAGGLYGVIGSFVNERRREFAIRSALGATPSDLRGLVFRETAMLAGGGILIGVALSAASSRLLGAIFTGMPGMETALFTITVLATAALSFLSIAGPLATASRIDPSAGLRYQ
jgi:predicted permease